MGLLWDCDGAGWDKAEGEATGMDQALKMQSYRRWLHAARRFGDAAFPGSGNCRAQPPEQPGTRLSPRGGAVPVAVAVKKPPLL